MSWAGLYSDNIGSIALTADNCKVKVMVYKSYISNFDLKLENGSTNFEILVPNTQINQWEVLTFDLTGHIGQTITRLTLIPDNSSDRTAQRVSYWDNISFNSNKTNAVESVMNQNVHIFPNPVINSMHLTADQEINQIVLCNFLGQTVKSFIVSGREKTIDLNDISFGNYLIKIQLADGTISTQKVIKL